MNETTSLPPLQRLRRLLELILIAACLLGFASMLVGIGHLLATGNHPATRDVISYWAAGQQVAAHANPYDADAVLQLERAAGFSTNSPVLIMRNPPYALPLVLPLGAFPLTAASLLWSLLLIASLILSVHLFWIASGRPAGKLRLLGYAFAPALACVMTGQTAIFALLGLVLFLLLQRKHGFAAGLSLWLCLLKPHLFLPFAAVLLLWIIVSRRYSVLIGAVVALAASSAFALWLDPSAWSHYIQLLRSPGVQAEFIPSLGHGLRAIYPRAAWLQYLPTAVGCCWAVWFYVRGRKTWDWIEDGALLILVSLTVSPYVWITDHTIVLPALLVGVRRTTTRMQIIVLGLACLAIEVAQFKGASMHSAVFMFAPLFWLGWYFYVSRRRVPSAGTAPSPAMAAIAA